MIVVFRRCLGDSMLIPLVFFSKCQSQHGQSRNEDHNQKTILYAEKLVSQSFQMFGCTLTKVVHQGPYIVGFYLYAILIDGS